MPIGWRTFALAGVVSGGAAWLGGRVAQHDVAGVEVVGDAPESAAAPGLRGGGAPASSRASEGRLPRGPARIHGTVVDEQGMKVGGVPVVVAVAVDEAWSFPAVFEAPVEPVTETTTSAPDGTFELRGLDATVRYRVRARPPAPRYGSARLGTPAELEESLPTLVVTRGHALAGSVVDARGTPVAGALVGIDAVHFGTSEEASGSPVDAVRTAADGSFRFESVPSGRRRLSAWVVASRARCDVAVEVPAVEPCRLSLGAEPGAVVVGLVREPDGTPVAGARLLVDAVPTHGEGFLRACARSGADGRFRVDALPAGTLQAVFADADGHAEWWAGGQCIRLDAGATVRLDVVLRVTTALEGRVHEASGRGIEGALVSNDGSSRTTRTDPAGRFTLPGIAPGRVTVSVRASGWRSSSPDPVVEVRAGEPTPAIDVRLDRRPVREGVVVDEGGAPVGQARVRLVPSREGKAVPPRVSRWRIRLRDAADDEKAVTDDLGRFTLVADGDESCVVASTADRISESVEWRPREDGRPVVVPLHAGAVVRGRVLDPTGRPVPGVAVAVAPAESRAETDERGEFTISALPAGSAVAYLAADRDSDFCCCCSLEDVSLRTREEPVPLDLAWGRTVEVVLRTSSEREPRGPTDVVEGVVRSTAGAAIEGTWLKLHRGEDSLVWTGVGEGGTFRFDDVPAGLTGLSIVTLGGRTLVTDVSAGDRRLSLVYDVAPARFLEALVQGPDGAPVASADVSVSHAAPDSPWLSEGRFRVQVERGRNEVTVSVTEAFDERGRSLEIAPWSETVDVGAAPSVIRLSSGRAITGRVLGEDGSPLAGISVQARRRGEDRRQPVWRSTVSDAHGEFRLAGLPCEDVLVVASPNGEPWTTDRSDVAASATTVTLRLSRRDVVSGVVLDPGGRAVLGAAVRWEDPATGGRTETTGADGAFRFVVDRDQRGSISLEPPEGRPWRSEPLTDVASGRTDLVARFETGSEVAGELVTGDGVPVRSGSVALCDAAGKPISTASLDGLDHRFSIGPVRPGSYRLRYASSGWFPDLEKTSSEEPLEPSTVTAPGSGLRFVLAKRAGLRGRVLGTDVGGFRVVAIRGRTAEVAGSSETTWTGPDGTFALERQPSGVPWTIFVSRAGDPRCALLEEVEPRGAVEVPLSTGLSISGVVSPLPPGGALGVRIDASDRNVEASAALGPDGSFHLVGLPRGTYGLRVVGGGARYDVPTAEAGATSVRIEREP